MHHITTRGHRRSDIFKDEDDSILYLAILKEVLCRKRYKLKPRYRIKDGLVTSTNNVVVYQTQ